MGAPNLAGSEELFGQRIRDAYIRRFVVAYVELLRLKYVSAGAFDIVAKEVAKEGCTDAGEILRRWGIR